MTAYEILGYGSMIADTGRTSSYARALTANVTAGCTVLDIGTGPGILALLACRSGAGRVYGVESGDVIQVAREAAAASGFADRIRFIQADLAEVVLEEKVDGIVSDLRGVLPLFQTSVSSVLDARDRFLKPAGWMIAARDTMWTALVAAPSLHEQLVDAWNTEYGFDFSGARTRAVNQWIGTSSHAEDLLVQPQCWAALDYKSLQRPDVSGTASWPIDRAVIAHGLNVWFDCETAPGVGFSNSPASNESHVYRQAFFPWPSATALKPGDLVSVRLRADFVNGDYVWSWEACVTDGGSGREGMTYRQSSFVGMPRSSERLRKRGHTFVPEPTEHLLIDKRIIGLMDRNLPLSEIASRILAEFPSRFKDWHEALTRAGDLSERYSK